MRQISGTIIVTFQADAGAAEISEYLREAKDWDSYEYGFFRCR